MRRPLTSCPAASTSDSDTRTLLVMSSSRPRISTAPTVTACAAPANRKDNAAMAAMRWGRRIAGGYRSGVEGRLTDPCRNDATPAASLRPCPHPAPPPQAGEGARRRIASSPPHAGRGKMTYRFESCRLREGARRRIVSIPPPAAGEQADASLRAPACGREQGDASLRAPPAGESKASNRFEPSPACGGGLGGGR